MGPSTDELRSEIAAKRDDIGRDIDTIEDRVSPGRIIHRRQTAMRMKAQDVRDKVMGVRDSADSALHNATGAVTHTAQSTGAGALDAAQGRPLVAGLVAFGVGVVASSLLPPTRAEKNAVAHAQQPLESAAAELGAASHRVADDVRPAAEQAVAEVKATAQDSMANVKEHAGEVRSDLTS